MSDRKITAMTVLKNKLQFVVDELKYVNPNTEEHGYKRAMENVIKDIDAQMLELEKHQIRRAYVDAQIVQSENNYQISENYYNQTYPAP